ncbi:MAG: hypothetical protein IKL56_10350 [Bacteroidaceae bacterium]|nr:hypothetical protein [Bacteroidaceae bacterium]
MKSFFSALAFILFSFCMLAAQDDGRGAYFYKKEYFPAPLPLVWHSAGSGRHGVEGLRFGNVITLLIREGNRVDVSSNAAYTLLLNCNEYKIFEGKQSFEIE